MKVLAYKVLGCVAVHDDADVLHLNSLVAAHYFNEISVCLEQLRLNAIEALLHRTLNADSLQYDFFLTEKTLGNEVWRRIILNERSIILLS